MYRFADFKNICSCSSACKYVDCLCSSKTCADFILEDCEYMSAFVVGKTEFNLCTVSKLKCVEMTDTIKLTKDNCGYETNQNYHWTKDGKCEGCADLISEDSSSRIIFGMILILFIAWIEILKNIKNIHY